MTGKNDPDILSVIAASTALSISNIPWNGPVAAVRVGQMNSELILNPVNGEVAEGKLDLVISGTKDKINMIEAGAKEVPEAELLKAFEFSFEAIKKIADFISHIQKEAGNPKAEPALIQGSPEFENKVKEILLSAGLAEVLYGKDKKAVIEKTEAIKEKIKSYVRENFSDYKEIEKMEEVAEQIFEEASDEIVHRNILEKEQRPDGRKLDEIRRIDCRVGILPRTHGTGLFTRGETQALTVTTLGSPGDEQIIDTMEVDMKKRYIHLYNFPPYSVGEVKPMRGPGRRDIGHGALAEKALLPVLPSKDEFPYTILLVSEILSSNGSSSMASTCGSTLSLRDAGVPIKRPVAGIAMGIIVDPQLTTDNKQQFKILTDIQGLEDHYGDMDFKVAGTEMSQYAPRIIVLKINPEKIRSVIGPGGKIINAIIDETGVQIDIEDDGSVFITSPDSTSAQKAKQWIDNLTHEVKVGELFNGKITRLMNFGAFAEILPGQEGLIHISELADYRVNKVEDIVKIGDVVPVKVIEIDHMGRINLSLRQAAIIK